MTPHEAQVLRIIRMFEPLTTLLRRSYVRPNFVSIGLIFMYTYHRSAFPVPVKCPRISSRITASQRLKIANRALPFDRILTCVPVRPMPRIKYFFALLYPQAIVTKLIQDGGPLPVEGPRGVGAQIYKMSVGMHLPC